ncbi:hypothetical protein B0H16DRAFT_1504248 [Mycena metata]|uniref:Uncharacterized protein n=1 Tax=Mycena metata TaxID=1033252 RepID=A0AAD7K751_9AGAR|nr:hypothetical protein B0H16DRAFT_1504248 [Mycena metata]
MNGGRRREREREKREMRMKEVRARAHRRALAAKTVRSGGCSPGRPPPGLRPPPRFMKETKGRRSKHPSSGQRLTSTRTSAPFGASTDSSAPTPAAPAPTDSSAATVGQRRHPLTSVDRTCASPKISRCANADIRFLVRCAHRPDLGSSTARPRPRDAAEPVASASASAAPTDGQRADDRQHDDDHQHCQISTARSASASSTSSLSTSTSTATSSAFPTAKTLRSGSCSPARASTATTENTGKHGGARRQQLLPRAAGGADD